MKDTHTTFLCGIGVAALLIAFVPGTFTQAKDALEQCKKSLPRDQECVIIAIPKDKK
jgi:hypothetical protein